MSSETRVTREDVEKRKRDLAFSFFTCFIGWLVAMMAFYVFLLIAEEHNPNHSMFAVVGVLSLIALFIGWIALYSVAQRRVASNSSLFSQKSAFLWGAVYGSVTFLILYGWFIIPANINAIDSVIALDPYWSLPALITFSIIAGGVGNQLFVAYRNKPVVSHIHRGLYFLTPFVVVIATKLFVAPFLAIVFPGFMHKYGTDELAASARNRVVLSIEVGDHISDINNVIPETIGYYQAGDPKNLALLQEYTDVIWTHSSDSDYSTTIEVHGITVISTSTTSYRRSH